MNPPNSFTRLGLSLAVVFASFALAASANADTNGMRAARLTYIQGTVMVNQPNGAESVPGQMNLPLLAGVQLVTGNDGQAEVEFEDGSIVRLTPNSALSVDNLAIQPDGVFITNLSLLRGLAYCELRATPQYRYYVNAGGDILSPVENTTVRINFDEPPAIFSVLDGTAEVERQGTPNGQGPSGYQTQIRAGESLRADGAAGSRYFLTQQIADDSWDQWNEDRDQAASAEATDNTAVRNDYAGADGYGWSDLDASGNWYNVPGQGAIWQPQIALDDTNFDPYGNGAWVYYQNAGYVWASGYSWGWTPYRCGNWSYYSSFGWGWAPGSGCGSRGWGFGGGRPVNIIIGPTGYRPIRVPAPGGAHPRPILPVLTSKAWVQTGTARGDIVGPRQIAGVTAQPIQRQQSVAEPGGGGSALHRDFPIDARSKAPVLGLASTSPAVVHTTSGMNSIDQRQRPTGASQSDQVPGETYGGRRYPSNVQPAPASTATQPQPTRPAPSAPETRRPADNPTPAQPALNRYPSYSRPADNSTAPSQPPPSQNPAPRPAEPPSSYQRNQPQPTVRSAPPTERPAERSSPPPASAPSHPSSPPPSPPASHPTTEPGTPHPSPN